MRKGQCQSPRQVVWLDFYSQGNFLIKYFVWVSLSSAIWVMGSEEGSLVVSFSPSLECIGRSVVSDSLRPQGLSPTRLLCPWDSSGSTGVGSHSLLQGIFPTQGSNPSLLQRGQILYHLSHQGSFPSFSMAPTQSFLPGASGALRRVGNLLVWGAAFVGCFEIKLSILSFWVCSQPHPIPWHSPRQTRTSGLEAWTLNFY